MACFAGTVSAGVVSGLLMRYWRGKVSYLKLIAMGILVEFMHLFLYLPLFTIGSSWDDIFSLMRNLVMPMTLTNVIGLVLFEYILELRKVGTGESLKQAADEAVEPSSAE